MYSTRTQQITWLYSQQLCHTLVHVGAQRIDGKSHITYLHVTLKICTLSEVKNQSWRSKESVLVYKFGQKLSCLCFMTQTQIALK